MNRIIPLFAVLYSAVALLFALAALAIIGLAAWELSQAVNVFRELSIAERAALAIESIGLITVALMTIEMAQTVIEEEVIRRAQVSAPTRVRRYVSRFLVVVVVALSIESLVAVVQSLHTNTADLPNAAAVAGAAALLLAAWGVFVHLNRSVEELEPEALDEARSEDSKMK